jgi:uncharacterized protein with GYD domain
MLGWKEMTRPREAGREGGSDMPTYISLINWTDEGIRSVKETLDRAARAEELAQKYGGRFERLYWTVGSYDIVTILEAPDDESATALLLEIGSLGNVRTTTLRAYDREQMSGIIQRLG